MSSGADKLLDKSSETGQFTDGSKTDNGTCFGVYGKEKDIHIFDSVEHTANVFQPEIQANTGDGDVVIN